MARQKIEWRFVHFGSENDELELGGLPVWHEGREEWREALEPVFLSDPSDHSLRHRLGVYEIGPADSPVCFAAGEFSKGIWGFFIPAHDWRYRVVDVVPVEGLGKIILLAGATDLPTEAQVTVRLKMPDGAVVEVAGLKAWELSVDGPPFEQDAFLLPNVDWDIPKGALAEVAEPGREASPKAPATVEEPSSPSSPEPAFVQDILLAPEVERDIPESLFADVAPLEREIVPEAPAAGKARASLSPQDRARIAAIGNVGLAPVVIAKSLQAEHASPEAIPGAEVLHLVGNKTILVLWIVYLISAAYVIFHLKNVFIQIIGLFRVLNFFGEVPKQSDYEPFIWLGVSIFYLAIGPVAILNLDRIRQIRV